MSAIAGLVRFDGKPVRTDEIQALTAPLAVNGQDGINHWCKDRVALGHCMLRTTAEASGENQPLRDNTTGNVLVMDGRIDNRAELERIFASRSITLHTRTDAELVLRAYEVWGEAAPANLLGDFAFAVWDAGRGRLFCAVDHMGACPCYYAVGKGFLAFASTEEALLAITEISNEPNEDLVAAYLVPSFQDFDPASSWLRDVRVMLPGQSITVSWAGEITFQTYWQWEAGADARYSSEAEACETFLEIFESAVRCRLRSAGTVAQMLSGGLDSGSILSVARQAIAAGPSVPLRTYSLVSDSDEFCRETQGINALSRGMDGYTVSLPSFQGMVSLADLVEVSWKQAHPCDNSIILPAMMCLAAARGGDRVMLHGVSGDVATHLPDRYPAHFLAEGHWRRAWTECVAASRNNHYMLGVAPQQLFALALWTAYAPAGLKRVVHRLKARGFQEPPSIISDDFANRMRLAERMQAQRRQDASHRRLARGLQPAQARLLNGRTGPALGLGGYARLGKRFGMDMRDPWGDRRVVEYFLRLPLEFKAGQGWTKYVVRRSLQGSLGHSFAWRIGKEHLGWHLTRSVMEESRALVREAFETHFGRVTDYLSRRRVEPYLARFLAGDGGDDPQAHADRDLIYAVLVLMLWRRRLAALR